MNKKAEIARAMATAYIEVGRRDEDIATVLEQFPEVYPNILEAMWFAIEAYDEIHPRATAFVYSQEHTDD